MPDTREFSWKLACASIAKQPEQSNYIMPLLPYLERLAARENLSAADAETAMQQILEGRVRAGADRRIPDGAADEGRDSGRAGGLRARHAARWRRRLDLGLDGEALLDTCGTGGDGADTFNISTVAAFVAAGAGVRVAKHGNRAVTSQRDAAARTCWSRSASRFPSSPEETARAIREVGIGFLFAPAVHTAMKHAAPVRAELRMRTAFNLLGPLTNPAGATAQLVGAPSEHAAELIGWRAGGAGFGARLRGSRLGRLGRNHHHGPHAGV